MKKFYVCFEVTGSEDDNAYSIQDNVAFILSGRMEYSNLECGEIEEDDSEVATDD